MAVDPRLIPGYEIVGRLASGGIAQVFKAKRESDGLLVALKVTSLAEMDPEFRPAERFTREAQLLSRLNHPALPKLYGYGVTDEALGWMALELVRGRSLTEFTGRSANELLPIFIQIAEALQTVAQEGIVHRDVAPDNVLVEERGARMQARLIDFGAAKDLLASGDAGALTRHGAFLGKLAYASPEQIVGAPKGESLDFRSDIYSLGLTMYELLAGVPAIRGDQGMPQIVDAHLKGSFAPLTIPLERGGPATRLVELVARMTARRREDRPASWEEVLAELWRSREEVSPLSEALAKKRLDAGLPAEPEPATLPPDDALPGAARREVLVGRLVLAVGALAFLGALAFAVVYVTRHRPGVVADRTREEAPPAPAAPAPTPAPPEPTAVAVASTPEFEEPAATAPPTHVPRTAATRPTSAPRPASVPRAAPTPRARPTARAEEAPGVVEIALLPSGDLEQALDENGRVVAAGQKLPARLELPPGRYRLRLVSPGLDCTKVVTVLVRSGKTTSVRETCIEIK